MVTLGDASILLILIIFSSSSSESFKLVDLTGGAGALCFELGLFVFSCKGTGAGGARYFAPSFLLNTRSGLGGVSLNDVQGRGP